MKWLHRNCVPKETVVNLYPRLPEQFTINHKVEYAPKPAPSQITIMVRNKNGQEYRLPPINLFGQAQQLVMFPISFVIDKPSEPHAEMYIGMHY
jgi:hypothetical protein